MKSGLCKVSREDIEKASSVSEILEKFNYSKIGGNYRTLKKVAEEKGFQKEYQLLIKRGISSSNQRRKSKTLTVFELYGEDKVFCEGSKVNRNQIKKYLIKNSLLEYKCSKCGIKDEWQGEKISLHLDHINGINNDNRLENLRFLCPNCHSQTGNYGARNIKRVLVV